MSKYDDAFAAFINDEAGESTIGETREPDPATELDAYGEAERFVIDSLRRLPDLDGFYDDLCRGSLAEMSSIYALVVQSINALTELRDVLANSMGQVMDNDLAIIEGVGGFQRERRTSVKWDTGAVRSLLRRHVLGTVADPETGEVDPHDVEVVDRAMEMVSKFYSLSSPKVTGLRSIDADPDEYRETTRLGYRMKFIPSSSNEGAF
jgi:hypothetical protein